MMRVLPYRTSDDLINGVVITFVNITARTKAEEELRQQAEELTGFNAAMVGREQRMIKLKKEVNELTARQGGRPPYDLDFDPDA